MDSRNEFYALKKEAINKIKDIFDHHILDMIKMYELLKQNDYNEKNKVDPGYVDLYLYLTQIHYEDPNNKNKANGFNKFEEQLKNVDIEKLKSRDVIVLKEQSFDYVIDIVELTENEVYTNKKINIYWFPKEIERNKYKHPNDATLKEFLESFHIKEFTPLYTISKSSSIYAKEEYDFDAQNNKLAIYDLQYIESFISTFETLLYELKEKLNIEQNTIL